ncbi:site-2 protease family protein [bacterium]|nr:MAG: site-2 protease family protein [bacterium]
MPPLPPFETILAIAIVIFFAIGLHEYAHCKFADMAGDPTPRIYGRVTLKLWKHFEPVGTFMMIISSLFGVGLGWGRAAPANPDKMRNPRWDFFTSVAAGPISNVVQAVLFAAVLRFGLRAGWFDVTEVVMGAFRMSNDFVPALLSLGVVLNLGLAIFNLIPLGPLDGHWLVGLLMPEKQNILWNQWHRRYGGQILISVILISQLSNIPVLSRITWPAISYLFKLLTGVPIDY